jgi:uncharacterized protein
VLFQRVSTPLPAASPLGKGGFNSYLLEFLMAVNDRRCISCRKIAPKSEFLRVVRLHPSHEIALTGMGRSAYICPTPTCLQAARKKDRLSRILKTPVPESIYQTLQISVIATEQPTCTS